MTIGAWHGKPISGYCNGRKKAKAQNARCAWYDHAILAKEGAAPPVLHIPQLWRGAGIEPYRTIRSYRRSTTHTVWPLHHQSGSVPTPQYPMTNPARIGCRQPLVAGSRAGDFRSPCTHRPKLPPWNHTQFEAFAFN